MHSIRLRRPWTRSTQLAESDNSGGALSDSAADQKIDVPDTSALPLPADHRAVYQRRFNQPTGLAAGEPVYLSLQHWTAAGIAVELNDVPVFKSDEKHAPPWRIEISHLIRPANLLSITLYPRPDGLAFLDGGVQLVIG